MLISLNPHCMRKILAYRLLLLFTAITVTVNAQEAVDVTDQTLKVGALKEEELYFGFAQGDKIIFNFKEINAKELKEVEIVEYPNNSKFSDFKTIQIDNKTINVTKQGVYLFRFKNGTLAGRICKIQIKRIPANASTQNFNTAVNWITKQDTTWNTYTKDVIVGYDTTYLQKTKRELVKTEKREELIIDKSQRVHSQTSDNGNKTYVFFTLPQNQYTTYKIAKVISWAYWVGVGEEANQAWKSNMQIVGGLAKNAAALFTSPLGALAVGAAADLLIPKVGEDVSYSIVDESNKNLFMGGYQYRGWDQGKGVAGFKKFNDESLCQGTYFVCLANDNLVQAIDANVKVIAIVETNEYEDKPYTEMVVNAKYEKKMFTDPIITSKEIPVTGQ